MAMNSSLAFLEYLSRAELRNYAILVDCGPAMRGPNCQVAENVVLALLPIIRKANPSGVPLWLFADSFASAGPFLTDTAARLAMKSLAATLPASQPSRLADALVDATEEHFRDGRMTSLLVVTTGEFSDPMKILLVISNAIHAMRTHFELSISFLQVAYSSIGSDFLAALPEDVAARCPWPIVDALPLAAVPGYQEGLAEFVQKAAAHTEWAAVKVRFPAAAVSQWYSPTKPADFRRRSGSPVDALKMENSALVSLAFFASLIRREAKNYIVLLDCSEGMPLADWNVARHILARTLGSVYDLDKDGISVWVMKGATTQGAQFIADGEALDAIFWNNVPGGATRLSSGLNEALCEYFLEAKPRATSILVVVAAPPTDWRPAADALVKAAVDDCGHRGLTVSFLNVGAGRDWTRQFAADVNARAGARLADAHQVPASVEARRRSLIGRAPSDVVHHYVETFLPQALLPSKFAIQPSRQFYGYHFS